MTTKPVASARGQVRRSSPRPVSDPPDQRRQAQANKIHSTSLVEQIYARLESKIVTLALPPGALLSELMIGREFGVSRTTS